MDIWIIEDKLGKLKWKPRNSTLYNDRSEAESLCEYLNRHRCIKWLEFRVAKYSRSRSSK